MRDSWGYKGDIVIFYHWEWARQGCHNRNRPEAIKSTSTLAGWNSQLPLSHMNLDAGQPTSACLGFAHFVDFYVICACGLTPRIRDLCRYWACSWKIPASATPEIWFLSQCEKKRYSAWTAPPEPGARKATPGRIQGDQRGHSFVFLLSGIPVLCWWLPNVLKQSTTSILFFTQLLIFCPVFQLLTVTSYSCPSYSVTAKSCTVHLVLILFFFFFGSVSVLRFIDSFLIKIIFYLCIWTYVPLILWIASKSRIWPLNLVAIDFYYNCL